MATTSASVGPGGSGRLHRSRPSANACRITSASTSSELLVSVRVTVVVFVSERDSPPARNGSGLRPSRNNRSS